MIDPQTLKEYDEYVEERLEILQNIHAAVMREDITPEMAEELRKDLK